MKTRSFLLSTLAVFYLPAVVVKMPGKGIFRVVNWMAKRICRFRCKVTQLLQEQRM